MLALGIICAIGASALYNTSIALQALEARDVGHEHALRVSLIGRLVRNPRWLVATLIGLLGLAAGDRRAAAGAADRGPAVPRQRAGAAALARGDEAGGEARAGASTAPSAAIVLGVAGIAWAAPERTTDQRRHGADRDRPGRW